MLQTNILEFISADFFSGAENPEVA